MNSLVSIMDYELDRLNEVEKKYDKLVEEMKDVRCDLECYRDSDNANGRDLSLMTVERDGLLANLVDERSHFVMELVSSSGDYQVLRNEYMRLQTERDALQERITAYEGSSSYRAGQYVLDENTRLKAELAASNRTVSDYQFYLDSMRSLIRMYNGDKDMGKYGDTYGRLLDVLDAKDKS